MAAGTITLTNNSDAVSGAGTAFLSELAVGDFIVANVGGIAYTMPVTAIASDTALTIINKFTGPTMSGLAWHIATREQQAMITAALVAQSAEALRGLNYDKQNWQAVFSAPGDITVTMPDNSQFTGPSWKKISGMLGEGGFLKADKNLSDLSDKAKGRVNLDVDRLDQQYATETRLWHNQARTNFRLTLQDNGNWGVYSETGGVWVPLDVYQGGTGTRSLAELKTNMGLGTLTSLPDYTILTGPVNRESDRGSRMVLYANGLIGFQTYQGINITLPISAIPIGGVVSMGPDGRPDGSIIEHGSNANGRYTKFADGTMVCWHTHSELVGTNSTTGNIFVSAFITLLFPAQFISPPSVSPTAIWGGAAGSAAWCSITAVNSSLVQFQLKSEQSNGNGYPSYVAVGRWI